MFHAHHEHTHARAHIHTNTHQKHRPPPPMPPMFPVPRRRCWTPKTPTPTWGTSPGATRRCSLCTTSCGTGQRWGGGAEGGGGIFVVFSAPTGLGWRAAIGVASSRGETGVGQCTARGSACRRAPPCQVPCRVACLHFPNACAHVQCVSAVLADSCDACLAAVPDRSGLVARQGRLPPRLLPPRHMQPGAGEVGPGRAGEGKGGGAKSGGRGEGGGVGWHELPGCLRRC